MFSKRIKTIASLVPNDAKILDIGTDHCFVPIFLYKKEITKKITALDINPNPLAIAKKNLSKAKLENKITLLLNDGLNNLDPNFYDVIIIAGLGGTTIAEIINKKNFKGELILHPTNGEIFLRNILVQNNFEIIEEIIVNERKKINLIIKANYNLEKHFLTKQQLIIGPKLISNKDQEVSKYYENKEKFFHDLYEKSGKEEYYNKAQEYQKALSWRKNNL